MVGAGGIGCELLKTLVLSGFEDIEMIDLDTIDVSKPTNAWSKPCRHQIKLDEYVRVRPAMPAEMLPREFWYARNAAPPETKLLPMKESLTCSGSHTFSSGNAGSPTVPYLR